jgi:hypothetical protein
MGDSPAAIGLPAQHDFPARKIAFGTVRLSPPPTIRVIFQRGYSSDNATFIGSSTIIFLSYRKAGGNAMGNRGTKLTKIQKNCGESASK